MEGSVETTKLYFEARDAKAALVREQVQVLIERWGLSNFIGKYIESVQEVKSHVFDAEELLGTRPTDEPDSHMVALQKVYLQKLQDFKIEFLRRHGAEIPVETWIKTFAFLSVTEEIGVDVLDKMNIKVNP